MNKYLAIFAAFLAAACVFMGVTIRSLSNEKNRLKSNQTALLDSVATYHTKTGKLAASCQALELTNQELKESRADLEQTVKDLGVKLKRAEAIAKTATETKLDVKTEIRDSIVYRDTALVRLQSITWADPWITVRGEIENRRVSLAVQSRDTLTQVIHRVPKRFLGIPYGCKAIRQEIRSSNPHTIITYTEYIELPKNRKR